MRSEGDNGTSSVMEPVTLGSPGPAPAQAYLDAAQRLKGDAIAANEKPN
jgi:septum site-determining protein MinD